MPVPLPQYGNFGGNGDNDAWAQANRYITWEYNGYAAPLTGPAGSKSVEVPPDTLTPWYFTPSTSAAITVRQILRDIDRQPINDLDNAYLNHDLGYVPDNYIANFQNNINMGQNVYQAITTENGGLDWDAYVYGTASVPFIGFAGSAHSLFEEIANDLEEPLGVLVDEVVVVAGQQYSQTIDVYYTLYDAGQTIVSGLVNAALVTWNGFASAIGSAYTSLSNALGGAWQWLRGFMQENRMADPGLGSLDLSSLVATSWEAGDAIGETDLSKLDSNGDGLLTADDQTFNFLAINDETEGGLIGLLDAGVLVVDVDPGDQITAPGAITGEALFALREFGVVQSLETPIGLQGVYDPEGEGAMLAA